MSAINRANEDVECGDYGMARMRLASHLNAKGCDAALLDRLGRLSWEMHDLSQAGRYWLASASEGADVQRAIDAFLRRTGSDAHVIAENLPRAVMREPLDTLPDVAQERLRKFGVTQAVRKDFDKRRPKAKTWRDKVFHVVMLCVVVWLVLLVIVGCVNGIWTITNWLSD